MPHHHHSHRAGGSSLFGGILVGSFIGGWYLGLALGMTGVLACVTGTAIIFGGLIALAAVSVGIFSLVQFCRNRVHARAAARVTHEPVPALGHTQHITRRLSEGAAPVDQSVYTRPPVPQVSYSPLYQQPSAPPAPTEKPLYPEYKTYAYGN